MKPLLTRRDFHRGAATAALTAALPSLGSRRSDPPVIRLAVIGPGKRGMNLMRGAFLGDGFQVVAVCDVDANRLDAAKALADERQPGSKCFATTKHEEAMDRAETVERSMQKLKKDVERLEDELEMEQNKSTNLIQIKVRKSANYGKLQ